MFFLLVLTNGNTPVSHLHAMICLKLYTDCTRAHLELKPDLSMINLKKWESVRHKCKCKFCAQPSLTPVKNPRRAGTHESACGCSITQQHTRSANFSTCMHLVVVTLSTLSYVLLDVIYRRTNLCIDRILHDIYTILDKSPKQS